MAIPKHNVAVHKLPKMTNGKQARVWLDDIRTSMDAERPRMVLDGSDIPELDRRAVHALFCCLEEALKRNGDVKLAALPPGSQAILERAGAGHLFEIYPTPIEAANSFDLPSIRTTPRQNGSATATTASTGSTT